MKIRWSLDNVEINRTINDLPSLSTHRQWMKERFEENQQNHKARVTSADALPHISLLLCIWNKNLNIHKQSFFISRIYFEKCITLRFGKN